jgi:hypothetical protein
MDSTLGARLRSQRERQQIALETIAVETKINIALLDALERDDLSRWPGGLFRRAYVRTYAQKIGLDPEQVLREFLAMHPDPIDSVSPVEAIAQNTGAKRPRTRIGLMIAGLAGRRPQKAANALAAPELPLEFEQSRHVAAVPVSAASLEVAEDVETAPRLRMILPQEPNEPRRDFREVERRVAATARLCTRIACARDDRDLSSVLEATVDILDALGAVLWVWDPDRDTLIPALAHGYPDELVARLPEVGRCEDNSIAAAFRFGQRQIVRADSGGTGAFVSPLLTPDGCVGALALEFAGGAEQQELVQTLATLITAPLSTLFVPVSHTAIEEQWAQPDASLVAS